uniref:Uncharacterized protein n=1 Tax=Rhizophora mucronata TaxID=61149 RepID=A0A2P2Q687_RHIMU
MLSSSTIFSVGMEFNPLLSFGKRLSLKTIEYPARMKTELPLP